MILTAPLRPETCLKLLKQEIHSYSKANISNGLGIYKV